MIPRSAVQNVGDRTVVYLVNPKEPGKFVEREVRLGTDDRRSGLGADGRRARGRRRRGGQLLSCAPSVSVSDCGAATSPAVPGIGSVTSAAPAPLGGGVKPQTFQVTVNDVSFDPQRLTLRAGVPARVTFTRASDKTCATAVVFPSLNIRTGPAAQPARHDRIHARQSGRDRVRVRHEHAARNSRRAMNRSVTRLFASGLRR